jgi:hypothetical protein
LSGAIDKHDLATEKRRLLAETRADLLKRQLSNAENYDKAVLSLSTAFLGFSLAFLKDLVPIHLAELRCFLYGSWMALAGSVLCTIVSFWVSQRATDVQLKKAEDYYLCDDQSALRKSRIAKATDWVNAAAGVLFVLGLSLTTAFVSLNFERSLKMSDEKKGQQLPLREEHQSPKCRKCLWKRERLFRIFSRCRRVSRKTSRPFKLLLQRLQAITLHRARASSPLTTAWSRRYGHFHPCCGCKMCADGNGIDN